MFFTGFADEAAVSIDGQIAATKALGWQYIEMRGVDNVNFHDLPEDKFEMVCGKLADAGIKVSCFGSAVANWSFEPFDEEGYVRTKAQLTRALKRMQVLDCKLIRAMSFHYLLKRPAFDPESEKWIFARVRELVQMCADAGVKYGHENCMNYGGMSWKHTLKLLEQVNNPAMTLIYDTGNPVFNFDRSHGDALVDYQSSWEFYDHVKEFVTYVHIKDGRMLQDPKTLAETNGEPRPEFTWAGDGDGDVRKIVTDLLKRGYDGGFSMEPHMVRVFHDPNPDDNSVNDNYEEYGRRFEKLVAECRG